MKVRDINKNGILLMAEYTTEEIKNLPEGKEIINRYDYKALLSLYSDELISVIIHRNKNNEIIRVSKGEINFVDTKTAGKMDIVDAMEILFGTKKQKSSVKKRAGNNSYKAVRASNLNNVLNACKKK